MLETEEPRIEDVGHWFFAPSWQRLPPRAPISDSTLRQCSERWLIFVDAAGLGDRIAARLAAAGHSVSVVSPGPGFARKLAPSGLIAYTVRPDQRTDYERLLRALDADGGMPSRVVHLWNVGPPAESDSASLEDVQATLRCGFYSLLALIQAYGDMAVGPLGIDVVSSDVHDVFDDQDRVQPARATVLGPYKVIPQEYAHVRCSSIDLSLASSEDTALDDALLAELLAERERPGARTARANALAPELRFRSSAGSFRSAGGAVSKRAVST